MASPARKGATYEDLLAVPAHLVAEILGGDLYASPRPAPRHAVASSAIGVQIGGPFDFGRDGPGGWWILDEPELHFGDDVVVPDLAGWRRERMPGVPDTAYFTLTPDWICEVVSPSTERLDRTLKLPAYARAGVAHAWLVNPISRTLEIFRREDARWLLIATHGAEERVRAEPFGAVEIELAPLWGERPPAR